MLFKKILSQLLLIDKYQVFARNFSSVAPIIACKQHRLNYYGKPAKKDKDIRIASTGWTNKKSRGDYFVINPKLSQTNEDESHKKAFEELGINEQLIKVLKSFNVKAPTEIQARAIPTILAGRNSVITAETGCGKTLAYLIPILQQVLLWKQYENEVPVNSPLVFIISPNRELARQIHTVVSPFCDSLSLLSELVVGGHTSRMTMYPKIAIVDIVVASFGALSKLLTNQVFSKDRLHHVVLDEADTLLDDSFSDKLVHQMEKIKFEQQLSLPPKGCQLTMVSATMPKNIPEFASKFIDVESLKYSESSNLHKICKVPQRFFRLGKIYKPFELLKILKQDIKNNHPVIIFSKDHSTCSWISKFLNENDIKCVHFHGSMNADLRVKHYDDFKSGKVNVISCTDIGSRGLDTVRVKHVINYDFPIFMADYIHRCGRTGRVGSSGSCLVTNLISSTHEVKMVQKIEMAIRKNLELPNIDNNIPGILQRYHVKVKNKIILKPMLDE